MFRICLVPLSHFSYRAFAETHFTLPLFLGKANRMTYLHLIHHVQATGFGVVALSFRGGKMRQKVVVTGLWLLKVFLMGL